MLDVEVARREAQRVSSTRVQLRSLSQTPTVAELSRSLPRFHMDGLGADTQSLIILLTVREPPYGLSLLYLDRLRNVHRQEIR